MPETLPDGSIIYHYADELSDVLFNGESVIGLELLEVKIEPSGYGWIMCRRLITSPDTPAERMVDGQYLTHTYHGEIEVIP